MVSQSNKSMKYLLSDEFSQFFDDKYPIFYKNKISKGKSEKCRFFYRSALDQAIAHDQAKSIQEILDYIVVH